MTAARCGSSPTRTPTGSPTTTMQTPARGRQRVLLARDRARTPGRGPARAPPGVLPRRGSTTRAHDRVGYCSMPRCATCDAALPRAKRLPALRDAVDEAASAHARPARRRRRGRRRLPPSRQRTASPERIAHFTIRKRAGRRRHGDRLPGARRADEPRRRAQGDVAPPARRTRRRGASSRRPGSRAGSTTPTSSRSTSAASGRSSPTSRWSWWTAARWPTSSSIMRRTGRDETLGLEFGSSQYIHWAMRTVDRCGARARLRPPPGRRAPRHQADEPAAQPGAGDGQDRRLRPRGRCRGHADDDRRDGDGDGLVHGARADPRRDTNRSTPAPTSTRSA